MNFNENELAGIVSEYFGISLLGSKFLLMMSKKKNYNIMIQNAIIQLDKYVNWYTIVPEYADLTFKKYDITPYTKVIKYDKKTNKYVKPTIVKKISVLYKTKIIVR